MSRDDTFSCHFLRSSAPIFHVPRGRDTVLPAFAAETAASKPATSPGGTAAALEPSTRFDTTVMVRCLSARILSALLEECSPDAGSNDRADYLRRQVECDDGPHPAQRRQQRHRQLALQTVHAIRTGKEALPKTEQISRSPETCVGISLRC